VSDATHVFLILVRLGALLFLAGTVLAGHFRLCRERRYYDSLWPEERGKK
jgi:hypothetical protein